MRRLTGMLLLGALYATAAQAAEPTTVVGDRVNARGKPTLKSEVITQLRDGETVVFLREITLTHPGPGEPSRWAQIELPDAVWTRLNWGWTVFFLFMGIANLYVAWNFSTETWVNFKLFGSTGLMIIFVIGQALYLARHMPEKEQP